MAATYDNTLPTAKDRIRHQVADTDMANPLRPDEEYLAALANAGSATNAEALATLAMAQSLASEYAQLPTTISDDGTALSWSDRVKTWLALVSRIEGEVAAAKLDTSVNNKLKTVRARRRDDCDIYSEYYRGY